VTRDGTNGTLSVAVRDGREADVPALTDIYNHYVVHHHSSFDTEPTTLEKRLAWFRKYAASGPYRLFVAEEAGRVLGCAYSSRYREHPAFDRTIEVSVHLASDVRSRGVGTALYTRLFEALRGQGLHRAVAGIGLPNDPSVRLHKKFGFREVGVFDEYAVKGGKYISSVWLQKDLDA